ncbi:MAG TPA: DUF92 domain-containing protein [Gemmatimonadaceae bacterium]|nr:DUF92 domain-containing protein [Gemmatimonadaceae bacterium]
MSILARLAIAIGISLAISLLARRARSLDTAGAAAATVTGTLALLAGWRWGVLLVVYFASASALSHFGAARKDENTSSVVEKGGSRDAWQVIANGGVFALAAALAVVLSEHEPRWLALGIGALAASASDTWATEIGTLYGGTPRSILDWSPVPVGMSGGVTVVGVLAAIAGAAFTGVAALALGWPLRVAMASVVGGIVGSTLDSLLGATLQQRRWCDRCNRPTERAVHDCGTPTRLIGGFAVLNNDTVNVLCGLAGGLLALVITG